MNLKRVNLTKDQQGCCESGPAAKFVVTANISHQCSSLDQFSFVQILDMHSSQIPQQCANDSAETVDGSLDGDGGAGRMVVHGSVW